MCERTRVTRGLTRGALLDALLVAMKALHKERLQPFEKYQLDGRAWHTHESLSRRCCIAQSTCDTSTPCLPLHDSSVGIFASCLPAAAGVLVRHQRRVRRSVDLCTSSSRTPCPFARGAERTLGTKTTPNSNFLKNVQWSPDGACILTASDDNQ
jgi:hypothetical protein